MKIISRLTHIHYWKKRAIISRAALVQPNPLTMLNSGVGGGGNFSTNENLFNSTTPTAATETASPNRSKYERRFFKKLSASTASSASASIASSSSSALPLSSSTRRPLSEKTKVIGNGSSHSSSTCSLSSADLLARPTVEFEDLFHVHSHSQAQPQAPAATESVLKAALSDALRENEQLCDTVKLLKLEIERLQGELEEQKEYAELYLLSKELIEQQTKEIEELKRKLMMRSGTEHEANISEEVYSEEETEEAEKVADEQKSSSQAS